MMTDKLSEKQLDVFLWWREERTRDFDGIICDGAVRSGKTFALSLSFTLWAMTSFDGKRFALCSKTIASLKRNLLPDIFSFLKLMKMPFRYYPSKNKIEIGFGRHRNDFYLFGGKDESSAALIQGITLAGVLFDEAVLMPRTFVEQACARCSVKGSKIFMCCNPDNPYHWFKREWIDKAKEKNLLYRHFTMEDNPSLTEQVRLRYERLYQGVFYERFVLGKWTAVSGLVYPMFSESCIVDTLPEMFDRFAVSCDYGTVNPASFGLWGQSEGVWYRIDEYYYDSRREGVRRTDEEHYKALLDLIGDKSAESIVCDPSAASFIECIRRHGELNVIPARNDVVKGISLVSECLKNGRIKIHRRCADTIREFHLYRWDERSGKDAPVKEFDHAMDDIRYFVCEHLAQRQDSFFVLSLSRGEEN